MTRKYSYTFPFLLTSIALAVIGAIVLTAFSIVSYARYENDNIINPLSISSEFDLADTTATFNGQHIQVPLQLAQATIPIKVLGQTSAPKRIEINLTNQTLTAFEGDRVVHQFYISSGKWGATPTGEFTFWYKTRFTKMEGGSKAKRTYYYLPNVPYTMFFYNGDVPKSRGFGIHGAYWHDNFGYPMSHGCINMQPEEAGILYNWADPPMPEGVRSLFIGPEHSNTKVIIFGEAPNT